MDYIKLNSKNIIEYNVEEKTAKLLTIKNIKKEIANAEARLKELPQEPTDKELLEWARENYPAMDYSNERAELEKIIEVNKKRLEAIK